MRIATFSSACSILVMLGCSGTSHTLTDASVEVTDAAMTVDAGAPLDAAQEPDAHVERDAFVEPDAFVEADAGPAPSFDSIYESILVPRCRRCHVDEDGTAYRYQPRMTDVDTAYEALFDVPVETPWVEYCVPEGVAAFRVRAFDPDTSMLAFLPTCYVRDATHELSPEELAEIRAWISAGAPREPF